MNARTTWGWLSAVVVAAALSTHSVSAQQYQYPLGGDDGGYSVPGSATPAQPPARSVPGSAQAAQPPGHSIPGSAPGTALPADGFGSFIPPSQPIYPPQPQTSQWQLGVQGRGGTPGVEPGFLVQYVVPYSAAERLGIEARDYIVQINGQSIQSLYDLRRALAWSQGQVRILVLDHRTNRYMWHTGSLY